MLIDFSRESLVSEMNLAKNPDEKDLFRSLLRLYDLGMVEIVFEEGKMMFKASESVLDIHDV